eukprot:gene7705-9023_t
MTLLFYRKAIMQQFRSFVTTGWELMVDRLLEESSPSVYAAAFAAVSTLLSEVSRSVSHADDFDNGTSRRAQLSAHGDAVAARLVDHFDLLVTRVDLIDAGTRHVAINTLAYLADAISRSSGAPYWPTDSTMSHRTSKQLRSASQQSSQPQTIVPHIIEHFLAQLASSNDALVFACGKAILDLLLTQANAHNDAWVSPVLSAFVGLLRREGVTPHPLPILLAIMGVLPMLGDDALLATLIGLFPAIKSITDANQRVSYLIRTFELLIERAVASQGKSTLLAALMADPTLVSILCDETSSFREEIVVSMVASHHNVLSKYLAADASGTSTSGSARLATTSALFFLHQVALAVSEVCVRAVLWPGERVFAQEYCVRFVDWLCRVTLGTSSGDSSAHSQKLLALLRADLLEQIAKIPSDYVALQVVYLLALHLLRAPANKVYEQSDANLLISTLRRRFLLLDSQAKFTHFGGNVRDMVLGIAQYGRAHTAPLHALSGFWLGALEALYLLGLHIPAADAAVVRTLDDLIIAQAANKAVVSRARYLKRAITSTPLRATPAFAPDLIDFGHCLPIELIESANALRSAHDIFAYECKKAITGLAGVHYGASVRDRVSRETTLLSGSGDPVWLEVAHTSHPTLHTISLQVTVTNMLHFAIKSVTVVVGLGGHLEFPHPLTHSKHLIAKLLPERSHSFEVALSVAGLDHNYVTFGITYTHPSGVCEVENGVSAKGSTTVLATMPAIETRCLDYLFDFNEFLIPFKYNNHQFLQQWPRFEASFQVDAIFEGHQLSPQLINTCLMYYPFHNVHTSYFDESSFQFAYSSSTWFNDQICFIVSGMNKKVDGDHTVIQARFEFRSSNSGVLSSFQNVLDLWIQKIPRSTDAFLARLQSPEELELLNQWKDRKNKVEEKRASHTLLATDQEFY